MNKSVDNQDSVKVSIEKLRDVGVVSGVIADLDLWLPENYTLKDLQGYFNDSSNLEKFKENVGNISDSTLLLSLSKDFIALQLPDISDIINIRKLRDDSVISNVVADLDLWLPEDYTLKNLQNYFNDSSNLEKFKENVGNVSDSTLLDSLLADFTTLWMSDIWIFILSILTELNKTNQVNKIPKI